MAQNNGFDVSAFEAHLNVIYHNRPTDIAPEGLNLYGGKRNGEADALQKALAVSAGLVPPDSPKAQASPKPADSPKPPGTTADAADAPNHKDAVISPAEAQEIARASASDKLAQEALLSDPVLMRSKMPGLFKDLRAAEPNVWVPNELNMDEIDRALKLPTLPQADKNLLTVLKAGYSVFSQGTHSLIESTTAKLAGNSDGISENSFAVLQKSLYRNSSEDPLFWSELEDGLLFTPIGGAGLGAVAGLRVDPGEMGALGGAALGAVAGLVGGVAMPFVASHNGHNDKVYDNVKADYLVFKDAFHQAASNAGSN